MNTHSVTPKVLIAIFLRRETAGLYVYGGMGMLTITGDKVIESNK